MAYIRFDQMAPYSSGMDTDGFITTPYSNFNLNSNFNFNSNSDPTPYSDLNMQNEIITGPPMMMGPMRPVGNPTQTQNQTEGENKHLLKIKNMKELVSLFGRPDATDKYKGGIAIWSANTLKKARYGFLHRVEIIDENIASVTPVKHFSNLYIWVHIKPDQEQLNKILSLSKDYFYDRKKELIIIRSDSLDTAVAQAALLLLYVKGKVTFYNLVNNDMVKIYYMKMHEKCGSKSFKKVKKALYTILNTSLKG